MKRLTIALLLIISSLQLTKAEYFPMPLPEMIMRSELIIIGTIQYTDDVYFTLEIEQKLYGNFSEKIIRVKRFVDFSCASRWMPYAAGQKVLLFLVQNEQNEWIILSDGGEGELPVYDGNVYLYSWYGFDMPFKAITKTDASGNVQTYYFQDYQLYGGTYYGVEFNLNEFSAAVEGMKQLCRAQTDSEGNLKCTCKKYAFDAYKNKSPLQKWLGEYGQRNWDMEKD